MEPMPRTDIPKKIQNLQGIALPDKSVFVGVPIDQVKGLQVGDKVTIQVSGQIHGIRKHDEENPDKATYEVELTTPRVIEVTANKADMAMRKMVQQ